MFLNTLAPSENSKKKPKRVGRGIGCTQGKTCGRGHKGQHARAGGFHKVGFEGGQMPLQRRLPKVGFKSAQKKFNAEVRLNELDALLVEEIDKSVLILANVIPAHARRIKIIDSGAILKKITIKGVNVSKGAAKKIIGLGGKIEV